MVKVVLASRNQGKLRELREILRNRIVGLNVDTDVVDAASINVPDVPETGVTFAENSLLKARAVAESTGCIAIADDSGLSVEVLHGAPGIFSARWAGSMGTIPRISPFFWSNFVISAMNTVPLNSAVPPP